MPKNPLSRFTASSQIYGKNQPAGVEDVKPGYVQKMMGHKAGLQAHKGGVDMDVQMAQIQKDKNGGMGICCGMSMTWVIRLLNEDYSFVDPQHFARLYEEVLRFQGAYFQSLAAGVKKVENGHKRMAADVAQRVLNYCLDQAGKQAEQNLRAQNPQRGQFPARPRLNVIAKKGIVTRAKFPEFPKQKLWAAVINFYAHAIAIGHFRFKNQFYIMDPNMGLYVYNNEGGLREDLRKLGVLYSKGDTFEHVETFFYDKIG